MSGDDDNDDDDDDIEEEEEEAAASDGLTSNATKDADVCPVATALL